MREKTSANQNRRGRVGDKRDWFIVGALFSIAIAVRIPGILSELPPFVFCDETIYSGDVANMLGGQFGARDFRAGGVNSYPVLLVLLSAKLLGFPSPSGADLILSGRLVLTVGLGALAVVLIYATAKLMTGNWLAGLLAGTGFVLSPYVLATSRYWYPDHYIATFAAAVLLAATVVVVKGPSSRWLVCSGIGCGLATSTKYSGILLLIPATVAVLYAGQSGWIPKRNFKKVTLQGALVVCSALATFLILNWSLVLTPGKFVKDVKFNFANYAVNGDATFGSGFVFNSAVLGLLMLGLLGGCILIAGCISIYRRNSGYFLLLVLFPVSLGIALAANPLVLHRNMTPAIPFCCVIFGIGCVALLDSVRREGARMIVRGAAATLVGASLTFLVVASSLSIRRSLDGDSRVEARAWVATNIPSGVTIGTNEFCSGPSPPSAAGLVTAIDPEMAQRLDYYVFDANWRSTVTPAYRRSGLFWWVRDQRFSHFYEFGDTNVLPKGNPDVRSLIPKNYVVVKVFTGNGPDIVVVRRAS